MDARQLTGEEWAAISKKGFDPPQYFAAYYNCLRWNCVSSTDASLLQAPFRAGIRLDAYQLEPLRKALRLPRVNLFIADDVGLGKTIEAGLIVRELLLRKKAREIVVACPPSMLEQWQDELDQRFGLHFEILDREYVNRVRRQRGFSVNPFSTHSRFLISHRLLIDEQYSGPLRAWLDVPELLESGPRLPIQPDIQPLIFADRTRHRRLLGFSEVRAAGGADEVHVTPASIERQFRTHTARLPG